MSIILLLQNRIDLPSVILALFILVMIAAGLFGYWSANWAAKSDNQYQPRLAQWAGENGWQLIRCDWKYDAGPFGWFPRRSKVYFRFVVEDQHGKEQIGWARFNIGGGQMDIRWDGK